MMIELSTKSFPTIVVNFETLYIRDERTKYIPVPNDELTYKVK